MRKAAFLLLVLGGCHFKSWKYTVYPPNPYPDIHVVAVLPFVNQSSETRINGVEFANIMASELTKFEGFRVIRPLAIQASLDPGEAIRTADDALRVGRRQKADAIIVTAITDYDPYVPPRIGISVQFLRVAGRTMSSREIDQIVQSPSWRRGPYALTPEKAGNWITAFEDFYDAHEERIRKEVVAYSDAQRETDTPFVGENEFLAVQPRYMQFVANQVLNHIMILTVPE